jgi:hypothetical protein
MIVEKQMECRLAGETEVLGENLPQRHFCPSQNATCPDPGLNPGRRRGRKPATNRLSYGAASPRPVDIQHFADKNENDERKYQTLQYFFIYFFISYLGISFRTVDKQTRRYVDCKTPNGYKTKPMK